MKFCDIFTIQLRRPVTRWERILHMDEPWGSSSHLRVRDDMMTVLKTRPPGGKPFYIPGKVELGTIKFRRPDL